MASKRKRVVLSITTKHEIIQKLESGESAAKLAKIYGIGKATITGIKNQKYAIEKYLLHAESSDASVNRKSLMVPKNKNVDAAVFQWFLQNRAKGVPISGPMLCEKALEFNEKLKENPNFKASSGWLEKFKSRHGIRELNMSGERLSIDNSDMETFTVDFNKFLKEEGYALQNVYKANKMDLMRRALPQEAVFSQTDESSSDCKSSKDHVIVLLCANATGCHTLPVLIIGKDKNFQCFKNANTNAMPIVYRNENNWNSEIFSEWFDTFFVPVVKERQLKDDCKEKTLLLIDDIRLHSTCDILNGKDEFIKVMFLPPNLSPLVQPMDRSVIKCFKRLYRNTLHENFLLPCDDKEGQEKLNMKECCGRNAWSNIANAMIKRAWEKLSSDEVKKIDEQETISEDRHETVVTLCRISECKEHGRIDIMEQHQLNQNNNSRTHVVNNDIANNILNCNVEIAEECNESDGENVPSHFEEFMALKKGLIWLEAQKESSCTQLIILKNLCNLAAKKVWNP